MYLDLKAELTALRDRAVQPRELGELFAMVPGMPEPMQCAFRHCDTYDKIYDGVVALSELPGFTIDDPVK